MAVNLSPRQFEDGTLGDRLDAMRAEHGLPPHLLELEITEEMLVAERPTTEATIHDCSERGYPIVLDDFGTGYSALSYLQRFPVDIVKLDRTFVTNAAKGWKQGSVLRALVQLARTLGIRVTAEGVECEEDARLIVSAGCDLAQGFGYSPPMPPLDLAPVLRSSLAVRGREASQRSAASDG